MDTQLKNAIDKLLNGGKPRLDNAWFISSPTAGNIEIALMLMIIPAISPVLNALFKLIDFIMLVPNYIVSKICWSKSNLLFKQFAEILWKFKSKFKSYFIYIFI